MQAITNKNKQDRRHIKLPELDSAPATIQADQSQLKLLRRRRFLPFFLVQFSGAFNDNIYKNALLLLIAFSGSSVFGLSGDILMNLAAGLFILPFFLFSALAGQIADKYEKSRIIRLIKLLEIGIMATAAIALWYGWYEALLVLLFLMGAQSAFFGPVKYAILPQILRNEELVGGNALVEMGTFLAILLGTIGAGLLMGLAEAARLAAVSVLAVAVLGWLASRQIPMVAAADSAIRLRLNPWRETWRAVGMARGNHAVFLSILAISWFWFMGASYLTQFPNFAKNSLGGNESVVTLLLATFTLGIGLGTMLCERLSRRRVELGIVPIGSLGLSLFGFDLYAQVPAVLGTDPVGWLAFLRSAHGLRIAVDLIGIGVFGGFFIVPLYAFVQQETPPEQRARVIAANNILNALLMVISALLGVLLLGVIGLSIPRFFLLISVANLVVAVYVYQQVPLFALRFIVWVLSHTIYRVRHRGLEHIPETGGAVLVCNHVSYMDALILLGAVRRPIRFVMDSRIFNTPVLSMIFRLVRAIPIAPRSKDPAVYEAAFEAISQELQAGQLVCIFPEGRLTTNGEVGSFRSGVESIVQRDPVPVVPMALQGLWGSFFSHKDGPALSRPPRRFWSRIGLVAGAPWPAEKVTAAGLEAEVRRLRGDAR